jgi:hypothetical protein
MHISPPVRASMADLLAANVFIAIPFLATSEGPQPASGLIQSEFAVLVNT